VNCECDGKERIIGTLYVNVIKTYIEACNPDINLRK